METKLLVCNWIIEMLKSENLIAEAVADKAKKKLLMESKKNGQDNQAA